MQTREQIETQIADLRRQRGFALLHNKRFDDAPIVALQQKLGALDDVKAEQARLNREDEAKTHQAAIKAAQTEIADLKSASAKALSDSKAGYVQGAASMKLHLQTEASLRKAQSRLNQLTGEQTPITNQFELERKRSLQIASVGLKAINNHPSKFGAINWPMTLIEWK
jgi:hypothetical protein